MERRFPLAKRTLHRGWQRMLFAPEYPYRQPFRRGRRYRVLRDFTPLEDEPFHAGDILIYRRSGHSIYDSMDGYFFIEAGPPQRWRRWDISTFDDIGVWTTLFILLPRQHGWWVPWPLLALGAILLAAIAVAAEPAPFLPQGPEPRVLPIPGMRRSACPLPEPATGRVRTYSVPGVGIYAAHGDEALLPIAIDIKAGNSAHGMDQVLFGAQTTFVLPKEARSGERPAPTESLGRPRQPMASLWGFQIRKNNVNETIIYRFALTAPTWEFPGPGHAVACLYFHKGAG